MADCMNTISQEIKEIAGVDTRNLMELGLLPPKHAKKWLVKQRYYMLAKTGRTYTDIKYELSERYDISVSSIEKIIYSRKKR
jgi:hypothetical protein